MYPHGVTNALRAGATGPRSFNTHTHTPGAGMYVYVCVCIVCMYGLLAKESKPRCPDLNWLQMDDGADTPAICCRAP